MNKTHQHWGRLMLITIAPQQEYPMRLVIALTMMLAATSVYAAPAKKLTLDDFRSHVTKVGGHCTTTCHWIGNQQVCNTYCY